MEQSSQADPMLGWLLLGKATETPSGRLQEQLIWEVVSRSSKVVV